MQTKNNKVSFISSGMKHYSTCIEANLHHGPLQLLSESQFKEKVFRRCLMPVQNVMCSISPNITASRWILMFQCGSQQGYMW